MTVRVTPQTRHNVLAWFAERRRPLPWRNNPTPWRVLVSELMLQQTRVDTVVPRFETLIARWPSPEAMARDTEADVVEAWAGLGYYARARSLYATAAAATELGGLPEDPVALRRLPGIGPYTAGAVLSLAFGKVAAAVDGNVERVLCRVAALDADPRGSGRTALWELAEQLVVAAKDTPGAWNEALIELGATVCTPRSPHCDSCPLAPDCLARATGEPEQWPKLPPRTPPRPIRAAIGIVDVGHGILWGRRARGGLLGGLWEPPRAEGGPDELRALLLDLGVTLSSLSPLGEFVHVFTHRRLTATLWQVHGLAPRPFVASPYDRVEPGPVNRAGQSALSVKALHVSGRARTHQG